MCLGHCIQSRMSIPRAQAIYVALVLRSAAIPDFWANIRSRAMAEKFEASFNSWRRKTSKQTARQPNPAQTVIFYDNEVPNAIEVNVSKDIRAEHAEIISREKGEGSISKLCSQAKDEATRTATTLSRFVFIPPYIYFLLPRPVQTYPPTPILHSLFSLSPLSGLEHLHITCQGVYHWTGITGWRYNPGRG